MAQTIVEQIADDIEAAYLAHTADASVQWREGQLERPRNDLLRRIVLVSEGGSIEPPQHTGGAWIRDGLNASEARRAKVHQFTAHITDRDPAVCEAMHENLIVALANKFGTAVSFGDYVIRTQTTDGARHTAASAKIEQPFTMRIAIPDKAQRLTTVDDIQHACGFGQGEFSNDFSRDFSFAGTEPGH